MRDDIGWKLGLILAALLFCLTVPAKVHADVNDFVVHDFHGRYELSKDVHAGKLAVTETIKLTFSDQNHGIERAIPVDYRGSLLKLDIKSVTRDGQQEDYTTYRQSNNQVLRIGDADKTITGQHAYEIKYEMRNIIDFYSEYDEWYWDINGDQWQQPFERSAVRLLCLPAGKLKASPVRPATLASSETHNLFVTSPERRPAIRFQHEGHWAPAKR